MAEPGGGNDVNVKFGAQIDELKSKIGEVSGLFKELTEKFAVMAAVVGGGAAFKAFIDDANKITGETVKLSKTLGIAGDEAAALRTGLGDIGSDTDTYTGAFTRFSRQLKNNSEDLAKLGIDVAGYQKGQKTGNELFQESLKIITQYKAGIDQNITAQKLFGRNVGDVQTLQKLTPGILEEARKKNEELNLNISVESVAASKKYKLAINDVGDVLEGLKKTIGEGVMPVLTESSNKLAELGPTLVEGTKAAVEVFVEIWRSASELVGETFAMIKDGVGEVIDAVNALFGSGGEPIKGMQIFKNVLGLVQAAFIAFRIGFETVANVVKTGLQFLGASFIAFGAVADRVLHFDFAGAKREFQAGVAERNRILEEGMKRAIAIGEKGAVDLQHALVDKPLAGPAAKGTEYKPPGGTKTADLKTKNGQDEEAKLSAARQALLRAQQEADLALQKQYLAEAQKIYDEAFQHGLISTQQYWDAKQAIDAAGIDKELETKRAELAGVTKAADASGLKPEQKLKFQAQEAQLTGAINVLLEKRTATIRENNAAAAEGQRVLAEEAAAAEATAAKDSGDSVVARKQAVLAQLKALNQINAQDAFELDKKYEDESYAVLVASLAAKEAAITGDELARKKAHDALDEERVQAERAHQDKLTGISNQAEIERSKYSLQAQSSIGQGFSTMVNGLLAGVTKISDVFRNFGISVANTFTNLIAQKFTEQLFDASGVNKAIDKMVSFVTDGLTTIVKKFLFSQTAQTTAQTAGAATRTGIAAGEATAVTATEVVKTGAVVASQATQTGATVAGAATRVATEEAAGAQSILITAGTAIANIAAKAWEAAASVYASIASIPYVGPFLAPVMAVAAGAAVLGFASRIASSEGGEERVPEDRLNFVHKDETILPARFAEGLRGLIKNGTAAMPTAMPSSTGRVGDVAAAAHPSASQIDGARAASGASSASFTVHAIDAQGVKRFLMDNGREIAKSLANQGRNFVPVT